METALITPLRILSMSRNASNNVHRLADINLVVDSITIICEEVKVAIWPLKQAIS